jgi:ribonuclease P protein component
MTQHKETFSKPERLCSKKAIEALFENGKSFHCSPFHIVWAFSGKDIQFPAQVAFSVSKKSFRLAVTRNLIRRRTREAYRKNKQLLYEFLVASDKKIVFTIIYKGKKVAEYKVIENSVKEMIHKFHSIIGESESKC